MLVAMSGPDLIFYGAIAVAIIGLFAFPFLHQRKKRAEPPPVPVQPKVRQQVPPPPAPKPTPQKSAEQIFREAFPDMQVKPVFDHPFGVRAEACMLRDKTTREEQPGFRIDVRGDVELGQETIVDLVITLEDLSDGSSQPVYATQERYQDVQTGQFVLRSTIGKVTPPGRPDAGWTSVGVVPFSNIRAPKSGARTLRLSCVAVPTALSGFTVIDSRIRAGMLAAAAVNFEVSLVRKGYVEQRFARQNAAGLVVCLAFAFARHALGEAGRAETLAKAWRDRYLARMKGEDDILVAQTRISVDAAFVIARENKSDLKVVCRELLAYEVDGMAQQGLALCVEIGRRDGVLPAEVMVDLKALCRELGLSLEELHRFASSAGETSGADDDQECAKLIGLDLNWDSRRIRRHLLDQFMKWNARHPRDAAEREAINRRLEAIARIRQRYL